MSTAAAVQSTPDNAETASVTIPTAPEGELVTDSPQAGQPVTVRFSSSDAETGLSGFWYGVNEEVRRDFVAAPAEPGVTGSAEVTIMAPASGGRVWIYMWAVNQVGDSSHRALLDFFVSRPEPEPPVAVEISRWPLFGATDDVVGDNHLLLPGELGTDFEWLEDRFCFPEGSLWLDGSRKAYAHTTGTMLTTDESFSIATWVKIDTLTGDYQTVLSQGGVARQAVQLQATPDGRWRFAVPHRSPSQTTAGVAETEPGSVEPGVWNHLTGVLDLEAGEVRLYVDGEHASTGATATTPRRAWGPFYVGVGGNAFGWTVQPLHGSVDTPGVWSSTLLPSQIRDIGVPPQSVPNPCF